MGNEVLEQTLAIPDDRYVGLVVYGYYLLENRLEGTSDTVESAFLVLSYQPIVGYHLPLNLSQRFLNPTLFYTLSSGRFHPHLFLRIEPQHSLILLN